MNREKLGNRILTLTTIIALIFAIGGAVFAVMCPIPAHAAFVPGAAWAQAAKHQNQAPQTAVSEASRPSGVATPQASAPKCLKGCDSTEPPGFGWFLTLLFLSPMATYFVWWCLFRSDK